MTNKASMTIAADKEISRDVMLPHKIRRERYTCRAPGPYLLSVN